MPPKLYTLDAVVPIGYPGRTVPLNIFCSVCGREREHYQEVELVLDWLPQCDLVTDKAASAHFISEKLLNELEEIGAKGYECRKVTMSLSDDFRRSYPKITDVPRKLRAFQYFAITGLCDGPWVQNTKGEACIVCNRTRAKSDFDTWMDQKKGKVPKCTTLVFPQTWHGEDFFYLSEPGMPLVTERVVEVLAKMGNLRTGPTVDQGVVWRSVPRYAEGEYEQVVTCIELGPADWVVEP